MMQAAGEGHTDVVRFLMRHGAGARVGAATRTGQTALSEATLKGRIEIMELLIDADADIDQADENGLTPLILAAQNDHQDAATLLLRKGCSASMRSVDGLTASDHARNLGHLEMEDLLVGASADDLP